MRNKLESFKKAAKELRMNPAEKERIRSVLLSHIQQERSIAVPAQSLWQTLFLSPRLRFALASLVLLAFLGGGTVFAAEGALPGDLLYPVKTQVTERVRTLTLFTPEKKAEWAVQRAERRLSEAEELVSLGRFQEKHQRIVEEQLAMHIHQATALARELSKEEGIDISAGLDSNMEGVLRAHALLISRLDTPEEEQEYVQRFGVALNEYAVEIEQRRKESELKIVLNEEASDLSVAALQKQQQARAEFQGVSDIFKRAEQIQEQEDERIAQARKTIEGAEDLLREGEQELRDEAFGNAFVTFQEVSRAAKEAEVLLRTSLPVKSINDREPEEGDIELDEEGKDEPQGAEKEKENQNPGEKKEEEEANGEGQLPPGLPVPDNSQERGLQGPPLEKLPSDKVIPDIPL